MNGQNPSSPASSSRPPALAMVDNVFRRALRVKDPRDADEVAQRLLARYPDDAARIRREQLGVPASVLLPQPIALRPAGLPEVSSASEALEAALNELTSDPDLADIAPALRGWSSVIRRAAADGLGAAGNALDPADRDRAFGARRILGDYARLSRYAGALTTCAPDVYCRVARGCDGVANVVLVTIGRALGDAGITRTGAVLQAPATLLQARRDAIIRALNNLSSPMVGDTEEDWPRGALALYQLYDALDQAGAPDLRALLDEGYLSSQLDELIDMGSGSSADGLRGLAAAAATTLARLQRLLAITSGMLQPPSPPATMFFMELQLFMQGFAGSNIGYRLPFLSQSPLLVSSFATGAAIDTPTQRLLSIALSRSAFADAVDCLCCLCDPTAAVDMILAGKALADIDRAIDLVALGTDPNGIGGAEWRGALYGATIGAAIPSFTNPILAQGVPPRPAGLGSIALQSIQTQLQWPGILTPPPFQLAPLTAAQFTNVVDTQIADELRWGELVRTVAPLCRQDLLFRGLGGSDPIATLFRVANANLKPLPRPPFAGPMTVWPPTFGAPVPAQPFNIPRPIATSLEESI
jgi:hypothetical protein